MRTVLIGLTLCAALAAAGSACAAPQVSPPSTAVVVTEADRAEFRAEISSNELLVVVMKEFPAEYGAFETQLLTDAKAGTVTTMQARDRASTFIEGLQTTLLPFAVQASDAEIAELYRRNLETMKVLQRINLQACYTFGEGSGLSSEVVGSLPPEGFNAVAAYGAYEMKVGISGRKSRISRKPVTEAEIMKVVELFESLGGDLSYLSAISDGNAAANILPDDRCKSSLLWTQAIVAQSPEMIARIANTK